jgi:DNA primase
MDARETIVDELHSRVDGAKKMAGSTLMIVCPFHEDGSPSCGVNLSSDSKMPLGFYNCFGCTAKGPWNNLAKKLGLTQFKEWELGFEGNSREHMSERKLTDLFDPETKRIVTAMKTREAIPWPLKMEWRGYTGKIIKKLGGMLYNDTRRDEMSLFFPIVVNNKFVGGVTALMEKPRKGPSYINSSGNWVNKYGLFGFALAKKMMKKRGHRALVVVEGPRDVIRLLINNIPGLAVLGVENFSSKKLLRIISITPKLETIYVMGDNDKAGNILYNKIKEMGEGLINVKQLRLPREQDKEGKLIKMDPDDAPQSLIDQVKELVFESARPKKGHR